MPRPGGGNGIRTAKRAAAREDKVVGSANATGVQRRHARLPQLMITTMWVRTLTILTMLIFMMLAMLIRTMLASGWALV